MDPDGFDYKSLRSAAPAPPAAAAAPFSMLQKPNNARKPFAFIQTQSRNQSENRQPPSQIPQTRRSNEVRMKQEPHDPSMFANMRQQPSQPRVESSKVRAFTMGGNFDEQFAPPRFSSPNPASLHASDPRIYAPSPAPSHASRSRSPSLTVEEAFDAEDADLSQLMAKRLRDAKLLKTKLAEQRLATAELESRLSSQLAASEASELALKNRITELESREATRRAQAEEELRMAKAQYADAERKLQEVSAQTNELRAAAKKGVDSLTSKLRSSFLSAGCDMLNAHRYGDLQTLLTQLKTEYDASKQALKTVSSELTAIRKTTSEGLQGIADADYIGRSAETRAVVEDLQKEVVNSHQVNDMLRDKLHLHSAQLVEAKDRISDLEKKREGKIERVGTARLLPVVHLPSRPSLIDFVESRLEELTATLVKKEEEGALLLAQKLTLESRLAESSERFIEVSNTVKSRDSELRELADKLAAQNARNDALEAQIKDERSRIASLEDVAATVSGLRAEKLALENAVKEQAAKALELQTVQGELAAKKEENVALQYTVKEHQTKISAYEKDVAAARDESAAWKAQLKDTVSKATAAEESYKQAIDKRDEAGERARQQELQRAQQDAVRFASLEESHRETLAKLEQANERARQLDLQRVQQDAQSTQLRRDLEHAKEQLRSSRDDLSASKADNQTTLSLLSKAKEDLAAATLREAVLQEKTNQLTGQVSEMNKDAAVREENTKRVNAAASILQDRFDSQAMTLKLAKEQTGDLQERLSAAEKSHAAELESTTGKLNVEIAVLREQKAALQTTLNQVVEESATQRTGFLAASADYETKMGEQKDILARLVEAEERKTLAAEKEATEAKRLVAQLEAEMDGARSEIEESKRKLREAISAKGSSTNGEMIVLQARLEELESENSTLQTRARTLQKRYQDGDLSDSEKTFVSSLVQLSSSAHEQEMVAKENELRRRENMINSQQTRIDSLESTLARLLKERGKDNDKINAKSMVDLNVWMSPSSPLTDAEGPSHGSAPPAKKTSNKPTGAKHPKSSPARGISAIHADASDDDISTDSEDESSKKPVAVVALGKRTRTPVQASAESSRPTRRQRANTTRKGDIESRKADMEKIPETTKTKQRKRR
ncbi:hypothetical protein HMN09_00746900 [Mycena chlorophos]|uniref:Uncharacterized protein n=1 Tax=Mycena chlorophos TaxID=658473 RepID=A0A8H6W5S6_MYCCL|nr:hypothetical protein HMN09_00746900 [Mycena chlorophos]